jgi:hypothetical protein
MNHFLDPGRIIMHRFLLFVTISIMASLATRAAAQPPTEPSAPATKPPAAKSEAAEPAEEAPAAPDTEREQKLAAYLSGATFSGKFTIDGKEDGALKTEEYTISKCEKLPQPDMYRLTARIRYGEVDSEVPLDIKILWSGNTPVITLDSLWIPGMGTFGARVLIHSGRYAGTWQHDAVGGHMFGTIKK